MATVRYGKRHKRLALCLVVALLEFRPTDHAHDGKTRVSRRGESVGGESLRHRHSLYACGADLRRRFHEGHTFLPGDVLDMA